MPVVAVMFDIRTYCSRTVLTRLKKPDARKRDNERKGLEGKLYQILSWTHQGFPSRFLSGGEHMLHLFGCGFSSQTQNEAFSGSSASENVESFVQL
mmetsp:Transcript_53316/g.106889  ORF Transcript_53316/g.106889 Transcript_53316/m.106889 type:complete len:96 (+) Transcript_53316:326-613(+)